MRTRGRVGLLLLVFPLSSVTLLVLGLGPFTTASTVIARNGCMLKSWLQRELGHESNNCIVTLNQGVKERMGGGNRGSLAQKRGTAGTTRPWVFRVLTRHDSCSEFVV